MSVFDSDNVSNLSHDDDSLIDVNSDVDECRMQFTSRILLCTSGSFFMYAMLFRATDFIIRRIFHQSIIAKLSLKDKINLKLRLTSSNVNAVVVASIGLSCFFSFDKNLLRSYPDRLDLLFGSLLGYTLFDMCVMMKTNEPVSMWIHHAMSAYGSLLIMMGRCGAFFPTAFAASELTVIPINAGWILWKIGWDKYRVDACLGPISLAMFLVFRTFVGPFAVLKFTRQFLTDSKVRSHWASLPMVIKYPTVFNMCVMTGLNLFWTIKLIRRLSHGAVNHRHKE